MEFIRVNEDDRLNYKVVKDDLLTLFDATANSLERRWDARYANVNYEIKLKDELTNPVHTLGFHGAPR